MHQRPGVGAAHRWPPGGGDGSGRPLILLAVPALWQDFFFSLGKGVESSNDVEACCRLIEDRLIEA